MPTSMTGVPTFRYIYELNTWSSPQFFGSSTTQPSLDHVRTKCNTERSGKWRGDFKLHVRCDMHTTDNRKCEMHETLNKIMQVE